MNICNRFDDRFVFSKNHKDSQVGPHLPPLHLRMFHFSPSPHLLSPHLPLVLSFLMSKMSILHMGVHGTRVGALPPRSVPQ